MNKEIMNKEQFNQALFGFLDTSPTPYHALKNQIASFELHGFQRLVESDSWRLESGQAYYVSRNDSSLIAFVYGQDDPVSSGIRILGAHTDSPCLKVKPNAEILKQAYLQLGVEVYGGVLLNTWFDRDLSLAGKLVYQDSSAQLHSCFLDFERPIAMLPSLAIHLDREANKNHSINPQTDLPPILLITDQKAESDNSKLDKNSISLHNILKQQAQKQYPEISIDTILDFELSFYDINKASYIGLNNDFIASSRLDNLLSCFIGMQALLGADNKCTSLIVCSDHEEVGSASSSGAQGTFLTAVLERLAGASSRASKTEHSEAMTRMIDRSLLISADNAHAIHPNFSDKHDANHGPIMNQGPVIKINANQRYASNCESSALFRVLANKAKVPVQNFVVRTDMGCGSTIGPITATEIGIKTVDIGVPTFAMHSIRELCGEQDAWYLFKVLQQFFNHSNSIVLNSQKQSNK